MKQLQMVSLDSLVLSKNRYRQYSKIWNFTTVNQQLVSSLPQGSYKGYGILRLFKCLLLQFMEDVSDRQLALILEENIAAKWFCQFDFGEITPHYSLFSKVRQRIGTQTLSVIFRDLRQQLQQQGVMHDAFTFVDATTLMRKAQLWKERDQALAKKYETLKNEIFPKVAFDRQAKIGCKGKN